MTTDTLVPQFDTAARLRYVDAQLEAYCARREQEAGKPATPPPVIPAPRRVRVFLRRPAGHGDFAQLTITHPVLPRPRNLARV